MIRVLAHDILFDGTHHRMSIAQIADDFSSVTIFPFREEIAATAFVNGCICIRKIGETFIVERDGKILDVRKPS